MAASTPTLNLDVTRLTALASIPQLVVPMSASYDLFSAETLVLRAHERKFIDLGITLKVPQNHYGQICTRQSLSNIGVDVFNTILDPAASTPVRVMLSNNSMHELPILMGDKIALLVVVPCDQPIIRLLE